MKQSFFLSCMIIFKFLFHCVAKVGMDSRALLELFLLMDSPLIVDICWGAEARISCIGDIFDKCYCLGFFPMRAVVMFILKFLENRGKQTKKK